MIITTQSLEKTGSIVSGYKHPDYARSFEGFGSPWELPRSKGWILKRQIPGVSDCDAMGCYPLFTCQDWSQLSADLEEIKNKLVAISLVTDPFGEYDLAYLNQCFTDVVVPFKEHFVIDLHFPFPDFVSKHHRRYARKALQHLYVERCEDPPCFLNEWERLYATLIVRHNIKGMLTFSDLTFARQLKVPGIFLFRAVHKETTVGMILWYVQDEVGYYHLGACSPVGYDLRAFFALFWSAIDYFAATGLRWLNLGAGAGVNNSKTDGLTRFKQGWSTDTRPAYFCGHIFNQARYAEIVKQKNIPPTHYFPAYRLGEFG